MSEPKVALLGAGYTLERVAERFPRDGIIVTVRSAERVIALRNRGFNAEQLNIADSVQVHQFFSRYSQLEVLVDGIPPLTTDEVEAEHGVRNIVHASSVLCPKLRRILYLSTTGVYGEEHGAWVTEERPEAPRTMKGAHRLACEQVYRSSHIPHSMLRLSAIYGQGRGIGHSLKAGRYPYIENGIRWSNRIHVSDLSAVIEKAIHFSGLLPNVINITDNLPAPTKEVVEYYCKLFNLNLPQSISLEDARTRGLETLLSNQRVSNELLKKTLSPQFHFPSYREGAETEFS